MAALSDAATAVAVGSRTSSTALDDGGSGQPFQQVMLDIDRDRFMSPAEAVSYGLIDKIVEPRAVAA